MKFSRLKIPTLVLAVVALVVGVTGGATAAKLITGKDIKDGSVTTADIKNQNLTGKDIKDGSLGSADIKNGTIALGDISSGAQKSLTTGTALVVSKMEAPFSASNSTVSMTPDGVEFGPYADGGAAGGTLNYSGANGLSLSQVTNLVYYARYTSTGDSNGVGVPYLRVFTQDTGGVAHDAIFSPNTQTPDPDTAEGPFHEWVATSGSWRYDDDAGAGPDLSYADLIAAHGTDTVTAIRISTGNSGGTDLSSLLRWFEVNGQTYAFGS